MKLKEKLAEEYSFGSDNEFADEQSFLAGFEKAREMAINYFDLGTGARTELAIIEALNIIGEEEEVE